MSVSRRLRPAAGVSGRRSPSAEGLHDWRSTACPGGVDRHPGDGAPGDSYERSA